MKLNDRDSSEVAFRLKALAFASTGGLIGLIIGAFFARGAKSPTSALLMTFGPAVVAWIGSYLFTIGVANAASRGAASIYMPSGSSLPMDRQYSLGQALVASGKFTEAAAEYERCAALYPDDPEPRLRLARLYRDELKLYPMAVNWFNQVLAVPKLAAGTEIMALRELIEVHTHRIGQPRAAAPHLARLIARHPTTPAAEWARTELAALKASMREDDSDQRLQ
jgi:tetratricopeptide (TPR) repeat protein